MLTTQPPVQPMGAPLPPGQPRHPRATFQAVVGPNSIFTVMLCYWVATGLQDTYLKLGLIIATGLAALHVFVGAVFLLVNARRVYPYILEITMLVIYPILLGITLASDGGFDTIQRDYNFIVNSALAGVTLISMVITFPLGIQHVQEMIPWAHAGHESVLTAGYWTSGALALSFIASCLLYLIPVCKNVYNDHWNAYNLIFRLIVPEVLTFMAVLFARMWPSAIVAHLQSTEVYDWASQAVVLAYPPAGALLKQPRVIDPAMLQPYPEPKIPGLGNNPLAQLQGSQGHDSTQHGGQQMGIGMPQGGAQDPLAAYYQRKDGKNNVVTPAPPLTMQQMQQMQHQGLLVPGMVHAGNQVPGQVGMLIPVAQQQQQQQQQDGQYGLLAEQQQMQQDQMGNLVPAGSMQQQGQGGSAGGATMLPAGMAHPSYQGGVGSNAQQQGQTRLVAAAVPGTVRVPLPEGAVLRPAMQMNQPMMTNQAMMAGNQLGMMAAPMNTGYVNQQQQGSPAYMQGGGMGMPQQQGGMQGGGMGMPQQQGGMQGGGMGMPQQQGGMQGGGMRMPQQQGGMQGGGMGMPQQQGGMQGGGMGMPQQQGGMQGGGMGMPQQLGGMQGGGMGMPQQLGGMQGGGMGMPKQQGVIYMGGQPAH